MPSLFIKKLYLMINECNNNNIQWIDNNKFIIHNPNKLKKNMIGIFKNSKIESFIRQLHFYGFKKVDGTRYKEWVYSRKFFTKDGKMLDQIKRNIKVDNSDILLKINEMNKFHIQKYNELEAKFKLQETTIENLKEEISILKNNMLIYSNVYLNSDNLFLNPRNKLVSNINMLDPDLL